MSSGDVPPMDAAYRGRSSDDVEQGEAIDQIVREARREYGVDEAPLWSAAYY